MSRKVCGQLTAAEKIRQMYLKNMKPTKPAHHFLSDDEIAETRKLFTYFDRNKDGHLDQREYNALMTYETSKRLSEPGLKTVFSDSDFNSDGLVSEVEFIEYRGRLRKWQPTMYEIHNLFNACDKNEDRKMSFNEFKAFWRGLGEDTSKNDLKDMFDQFDRDKDDNITKEELLRLVFHSIDQNKDRRISFNEILDYKCRRFSRPKQHVLKATFKRHDTNHDGLINLDDLRICWFELGEEPLHPNFNKWFETEDIDKDGFINVFEFERFVRKHFWKRKTTEKD